MTKKIIKHKIGNVRLIHSRYCLVECPGCGWIGSSEELTDDWGCMQPVGFDHCHAEANEITEARLFDLLQSGAFNPPENAIGWNTEDYRTDKSATTYDITVAARWREKGWPVWPIFAGEQLPKTQHADKCNKCDKITLGLSGETKWCSYCGGKLEGDSVLVAPMTLEPGEVEKLKEEVARLTGNIERQHKYIVEQRKTLGESYSIGAYDPVQLAAVGTLKDDGDGGLAVDWLLEGGTAELMAGTLLLVADSPELCAEDGAAEVFIPKADEEEDHAE